MIDGIAPSLDLPVCEPTTPSADDAADGELFSALVASMLVPQAVPAAVPQVTAEVGAQPEPVAEATAETTPEMLPRSTPQLSPDIVLAATVVLPDTANHPTTATALVAAASHDAEVALPELSPREQNVVGRAEPGPDHPRLLTPPTSARARTVPTLPVTAAPEAVAATTKQVPAPAPPLPSFERAPATSEAPAPSLATTPPPVLPHEVQAATPATPASPATPGSPATPAEPLHEQVAVHVRHLAERPDGTHHVRFELHPAELGHVQVEVRVRDGKVDVDIRAEQPHAVEALTDSLPELHHALDGGGLEVGHLDLDAWVPPGQARHDRDHLPNHGQSGAHRHDLDRGHGQRRRDHTDHPAPDDTFDALL